MLFTTLLPIVFGALCYFLPFNKVEKKRNIYVTVALFLTFFLAVMVVITPQSYTEYLAFSEELTIGLNADGLGKFFLIIVNFVWLFVGIYSLEYMKHEANHPRFYSFFLISFGAMNGVCLSGNYLTMYLFFEILTFASMPMVLHSQSSESISAAIKYLIYSVFGATIGLLGFFFISNYADTTVFTQGGVMSVDVLNENKDVLLLVCFMTIIGFGAKAGLYPLHSWLPTAHPVAPAAASSLLSGIITKAGVLAIIRVVYYQFGYEFIMGSWVQTVILCLVLFTVFMGSMLAYKEKIMKKRLAYSTVSQVSYILFGLFCFNAISFMGALLHIAAHALIKNVLFMVSGSVIYKSHFTRVDQLDGLGKKMPYTFALFTIAGLGLIGIPPLVGFVSKWYLATGSLATMNSIISWVGPVVLLVSALLTAGYLFTITIQAYFKPYTGQENVSEANKVMLVPMAVLVFMTILFGVMPSLLTDPIHMIIQGLF